MNLIKTIVTLLLIVSIISLCISILMTIPLTNKTFKSRINNNNALFGSLKNLKFHFHYLAVRNFLFLLGGMMTCVYLFIMSLI